MSVFKAIIGVRKEGKRRYREYRRRIDELLQKIFICIQKA